MNRLGLSLALAALLININVQVIKANDAPTIRTNYGYVQGTSDDNAFMYLGIPYAMPPVDGLRWEEPVRPRAWYPQVLNATALMPACPQIDCDDRMPHRSCPPKYSEDCLYLNIFTPKDINVVNPSSAPKAVMLFIHGGNFQYQGANSPIFDSRLMTNMSDTIIVIIQYRLGALGYLVTGLEPDQIQGNFGILDQRMAIKWVYDNIKNFGGDASRITLFGQSAGAESTTIHYLSSDIQDYFTNAIIQSSPMSIPFRTFDEAMALYDYFALELNCAPRDVICLKNQTVDTILKAQMDVEKKISSFKLLGFFETWLPWIDGKVIKGQLLEIEKWQSPTKFTLKPFIIGTLTEECYIYIYLAWTKALSAQLYSELMIAGFKQEGLKVIERFPPSLNEDQRNLTSIVATKWVFGCSSRNFLENAMKLSRAQGQNLSFYHYIFDFYLDFPGWDKFTFCDTHVCHGSDMPYTFDTPDAGFTSNGTQLSISHITYWTNFAKSNNPNGPSKLLENNQVNWPTYDLDTKQFLRFKTPPNTVESAYAKDDCDFFDSIGYYH